MEFEHDGAAWDVLDSNFTENNGIIYPKDPRYTPNEIDSEAIDYLVGEWDYGYKQLA